MNVNYLAINSLALFALNFSVSFSHLSKLGEKKVNKCFSLF